MQRMVPNLAQVLSQRHHLCPLMVRSLQTSMYLNLGFFLNRDSLYASLKTCRNFKSQVTLRLTLAPGKAFFAGLLFLLVLPFTGTAQIKKMAILPTLTYLDKVVLRDGIDSVSQHTIQRNEGYA